MLKKCCDLRYQFILMDLNMPILNGYLAAVKILQIWEKFKSNPKIPASEKAVVPEPVIFAMTAFSDVNTL